MAKSKARGEFKTYELDNNKHEDLDDDEQKKTDDCEPVSILSRLVSNTHVDDVARQLPAGARHVAVTGSVDGRVNSILLTAKANGGNAWCENLWFLIKARVPSQPSLIEGFPEGTTRKEVDEVERTLEDMGMDACWTQTGCAYATSP